MGYSNIDAQGLSAPPYFAAFILALVTTWLADKSQQRGLTIAFTSILGGIGYIVLAKVENVGVRYFATFLAAAGVFSTIPNILAWTISKTPVVTHFKLPTLTLQLDNQGSDTRRGAGLVLINLVGQCGPILGTRLYPSQQGPRYVKGMSVCAAFMIFATLLSISLRTMLVYKNRKLDQKYGNGVVGGGAVVAVEDYGPNFRYVL